MKNKMLVMALFALNFCYSQEKDSLKNSAFKFQEQLNTQYADSLHSPLTKEDRRQFKGLEFYPVDMNYCIVAKFKRTPKEKTFRMKTTTERTPAYLKYGEIYFKIGNKSCKLNVYQNIELIKNAGYKDNLFLPFKDITNGSETYGGGRYLDLKIPAGDKMIIDFNKAYNPYCANNHSYSCPVPPPENTLNIEIKAGVKFTE